MSGTREDAHRLVDALDEQQAREFAWIGMLSAEPDLAERSSDILRQELGNAE
jgi:hypothetical protein